MKIRCKHCDKVYKHEGFNCPSCGKSGGYLQTPSVKNIAGMSIHLEEILIHTDTKNEYKIKEIQDKGLMVKVTKSVVALVGTVCYISNSNIGEYEQK